MTPLDALLMGLRAMERMFIARANEISAGDAEMLRYLVSQYHKAEAKTAEPPCPATTAAQTPS